MKKAQTISEYALVLSIIFATILSLQVFLKRGLQAEMKFTADSFQLQEDWHKPTFSVDDLAYSNQISAIEQKNQENYEFQVGGSSKRQRYTDMPKVMDVEAYYDTFVGY